MSCRSCLNQIKVCDMWCEKDAINESLGKDIKNVEITYNDTDSIQEQNKKNG